MKTKLFLLSLMLTAFTLAGCETDDVNYDVNYKPNHFIRYTTTDGQIVEPYSGEDAIEFPFGEGVEIVKNIYENGQGIILFNKEVTEIGYAAFAECSSLESITIPDSVTSIGHFAFVLCTNLKNIIIPDSITAIGHWAFESCEAFESITIPDSVTEIGDNPFDNCTNLTSFYGKYASEDNRCLIVDGVLKSFAPAGLTSYTIPDGVTKIGNEAFIDCTSLTSITIPDGVTSIGGYAFYYCSNLESVYCKAVNPPSLNWDSFDCFLYYRRTFDYNAAGRKIYVPQEYVSKYKAAGGWSEYADDIVGYDF